MWLFCRCDHPLQYITIVVSSSQNRGTGAGLMVVKSEVDWRNRRTRTGTAGVQLSQEADTSTCSLRVMLFRLSVAQSELQQRR